MGGSSPPFEEEPPEGLDFEDLALREVEADLDLFPPLPPVEDSLSATEKVKNICGIAKYPSTTQATLERETRRMAMEVRLREIMCVARGRSSFFLIEVCTWTATYEAKYCA